MFTFDLQMFALPAQSQNTSRFDIYDGVLIYAPDLTGVKPCHQGDIVCFDGTLNSGAGGVRQAIVQADLVLNLQNPVLGYAGVAVQNSILNSLGDQLTTVEVGFKNIFNFYTTSGEIYTEGQPVYLNETVVATNGNSQQITNNNNSGLRSVKIGYVHLPQDLVMAGTLSITGAANIFVPVAVIANFPAASLA
jgi:hypothetical protein